MLAFVSDEDDVAIAGAHVLLESADGRRLATRSQADGGVDLDPEPGAWRVTLAAPGFGPRRLDLTTRRDDPPHRFRLLSDEPAAYMWPKWSRSGERAVPQVHAVESYRASVWRYGIRKERVFDLDWADEHGPRATMQVTPPGDYTQTGVRWGTIGYKGNHHHATSIAAPQRTGLYYLHVRTASGAFTSAPWVVAPAEPRARIAVLASTNNWNAYNEFGGRSNYLNVTALPERPIVNTRQDVARYQTDRSHVDWKAPDDAYAPLSFERPEPFNVIPEDAEVTDPIPGFLQPSLAASEWRMLAWLEREGFDHDLYADAQLHDGTLDLSAYDVLVLSTHPEYWSREMIERLEAWLDAGGRLLSLGGNSMNCEVVFEGEDRLRFRNFLGDGGPGLGMPNPDDPDRPLDSRLHRSLGRSEASILGVATTLSGFGTGAPYEVVDDRHWIFAGSGLRNGDRFGAASLSERAAGASGWETDKRTPWTPDDVTLLAKGTNPDDGGAELVFRPVGPRGAVIAAGSITYAASLLVDRPLSRVTANMVNRFLDPRPFETEAGQPSP